MDRTEMNASPVQKALQGIKKYKYVLLTALLGVLLYEIIYFVEKRCCRWL